MGSSQLTRSVTLVLAMAAPVHPSASDLYIKTLLLQPARVGDAALVVTDCSQVRRGERLRIAGGEGHAEEGDVLILHCPPTLVATTSHQLAVQNSRCDLPSLGWMMPHLSDDDKFMRRTEAAKQGLMQALCREMLDAVERLPSIAEHVAKRATFGALQPDSDARLVPGVAMLRNGLRFAHEAGTLVYGLANSSGNHTSICPGSPACMGRGTCSFGSCSCNEGFSGEACERQACAVGFGGTDCLQRQDECAGGCGNGLCVRGHCLCQSGFVGATCLAQVNNCPGGCSGVANGVCSSGICVCYAGYSGPTCSNFCKHNCTYLGDVNGRCSASFKCICKIGFSGDDCSVTCPNRCSGHGECSDHTCSCFEGYSGIDCSTYAPPYHNACCQPDQPQSNLILCRLFVLS